MRLVGTPPALGDLRHADPQQHHAKSRPFQENKSGPGPQHVYVKKACGTIERGAGSLFHILMGCRMGSKQNSGNHDLHTGFGHPCL